MTGRTWRGSAFGGVKGRTELPGLVEDYLAGKVMVDEYVTHNRKFDEINAGFHDMHVSDHRMLDAWPAVLNCVFRRLAIAFVVLWI